MYQTACLQSSLWQLWERMTLMREATLELLHTPQLSLESFVLQIVEDLGEHSRVVFQSEMQLAETKIMNGHF